MKKQSQTINFFILLAFLSFNFAFAQNSGLTYKSEQKSTANYRFRKTPGSEKNDIIYQRCEWTVDPSEKDLEGTITYYFKAKENNITEIVFNLYDNMIVDAVVQRGNPVPFTHADSLIRITLEPPLLSDDLDSLSIVYHGTPDPSDGYSYVQGTHNYTPIVRTHSEPYNAELWYPCKNNLKDKVDSTDIFITIPEGNMAASNGKLISVTPKDNNQVTFHWKHRYPIATYLVAFAVTNYVAYSDWYVRNEADSVEILNYVYPESMAGAQSMTAFTPGAMSAFEEIAGDYPFSDEKYGHAECIAIGGTEHQTMTFMGGFDVLTIVHELAHQWFGNMITCGSWSDIWLNEGFATYCEGLYYERLGNLTTWEAWKKSAITLTTQWENGSVYCYDTSYYESIFQPIVYYKGAMVLHMLRWVVGDEAFFQGMWNYAHDPALCHGIAFTSDFVKHIEEASGKDLTDFFDTWVYKEGYPNYTIKVIQTDSHHAQLDLIQKPTHSSVACFKMPIPIQFIGNGKDTTITFDNNALKQSFEFDPGFMVEKIVFDPERWLVCKSKSNFVGINDIENETFVEVYPNPFQNQITLKYRLPEKARWSLSDLSGKVLKTGKLNGTEGGTTLSVPNLNAGIYILNIQTGNNSIVRKIISE